MPATVKYRTVYFGIAVVIIAVISFVVTIVHSIHVFNWTICLSIAFQQNQ